MRRLLFALPLVVAIIIGGFAIWGLSGGRDPGAIPSVLISQPVPELALEPVEGVGSPGFTTAELNEIEGIKLLNVFASWCGPCRAEHPILTRIAEEEGVTLIGLNYKDKPEAAAAWLEELGNPYVAVGSDYSGRAGIELGISGVPETFIIDEDGIIRHRMAGPVVGDGRRRFTEILNEVRQ
ncbi:cytochrome c biogenesis protein CcmG/thiol:disulfide interchange protein DsbE [Litoreibacter ponti]|uniref:Cytochrome c biogenesis protein CcmG/thiol:disulfide interchange protein DsbE n=1 Tax=Litoreibacter ponti TaxID=1510457 RepID=A0A2T6BHK4_9RHOB|nr:DsbE family thiol:disulfide interchange protein [Litoreibacter ponti]PTX55537.1 cytochrome c biogenesis protein CcmG/thiol:disulfide interchange protein DsbE [Litoreibacter ponti]